MKAVINTLSADTIMAINLLHKVKTSGTVHQSSFDYTYRVSTDAFFPGVFHETTQAGGDYLYFYPIKVMSSKTAHMPGDLVADTSSDIFEQRDPLSYEATEWVETPSGTSPNLTATDYIEYEGSIYISTTSGITTPPVTGVDWDYIGEDKSLYMFDTSPGSYTLWDAGDPHTIASDNGLIVKMITGGALKMSINHFISSSITVTEYDNTGAQIGVQLPYTGTGDDEGVYTTDITLDASTHYVEIYAGKNTNDRAGIFYILAGNELELGDEIYPYEYKVVDSSIRTKDKVTGVTVEVLTIAEEVLSAVVFYPTSEVPTKKDIGGELVGNVGKYTLEDTAGEEVLSVIGYIEQYDINAPNCTQSTTSIRVKGLF